jgi:prephenate dehydrogenase
MAILGAGLIGGSVLRAVQRAGLSTSIAVWDRDAGVRAGLAHERAPTRCADSAADAVRDAEMVVLGAPVGALGALIRDIASHLSPGAVVTDVASVKVPAVEACNAVCAEVGAHFVPAHPIAGAETTGLPAARADLFDGRRVVLTPTERTDTAALARVEAFWRDCGATTLRLSPEQHDAIYAALSHLPHVLAYAFTGAIAQTLDAHKIAELAGTGFRDFTRIAAAEPQLWVDICAANREALLREIEVFRQRLESMARCLHDDDREGLSAAFAVGHRLRHGIDALSRQP